MTWRVETQTDMEWVRVKKVETQTDIERRAGESEKKNWKENGMNLLIENNWDRHREGRGMDSSVFWLVFPRGITTCLPERSEHET